MDWSQFSAGMIMPIGGLLIGIACMFLALTIVKEGRKR